MLQKLNREAQLAFVLVKYLPLAPHNVPAVVAAAAAASSAELWSCRAAGLVYLQYAWYRQCFLLDPLLMRALQVGN